MGRWTQYDEDSYRLPEGVVRTGYDADTGQYIFQSRGGETYRGVAGSQYGPMHAGNALVSAVPQNVALEPEAAPRSDKPKRRATLSDMPSALRNLGRSLAAVSKTWRRDHSPAGDDEDPVLVSRPASAVSGPPPSSEPAPLAASRRHSLVADSPPSLRATSKPQSSKSTEARSSPKPDAPPRAASDTAAKLSKHRRAASSPNPSKSKSTPLPPLPPAASSKNAPTVDPTPIATRFARTSANSMSPDSMALSRSATTSAARSAHPERRSRRTASEHVPPAHTSTATRTLMVGGMVSKTPASPPATGTAKLQKVPPNRAASGRTSSPSASARSTAKPRPRTSDSPLARSPSTAEAHGTLATALAT
ncbi:hypothetical protein B0H15DRAFT_595026 [Mycena belliarum]|uniref:Uncharacterized protein n=1 Tax=Mycena belliarum TaxID=1033014 RepID=A0AAD6XI82_9AGAR|nr:hypothetical protein B0H15DRAFT_595026 [Mycena belliae]